MGNFVTVARPPVPAGARLAALTALQGDYDHTTIRARRHGPSLAPVPDERREGAGEDVAKTQTRPVDEDSGSNRRLIDGVGELTGILKESVAQEHEGRHALYLFVVKMAETQARLDGKLDVVLERLGFHHVLLVGEGPAQDGGLRKIVELLSKGQEQDRIDRDRREEQDRIDRDRMEKERARAEQTRSRIIGWMLSPVAGFATLKLVQAIAGLLSR